MRNPRVMIPAALCMFFLFSIFFAAGRFPGPSAAVAQDDKLAVTNKRILEIAEALKLYGKAHQEAEILEYPWPDKGKEAWENSNTAVHGVAAACKVADIAKDLAPYKKIETDDAWGTPLFYVVYEIQVVRSMLVISYGPNMRKDVQLYDATGWFPIKPLPKTGDDLIYELVSDPMAQTGRFLPAGMQ